ncbi:transposase [Spirosoma areae]
MWCFWVGLCVGKTPRKSTPNRKYTPEFKADVLRLVTNGESILGVAQKMGISDSIIYAWRAAEKRTKGGEKSTSTLEEEVESLQLSFSKLALQPSDLLLLVS